METRQAGTLLRLAVCAAVAAGAIYMAETMWEGKGFPLWEKYGGWIKGDRVRAIAVVAVGLYAVSLALWPEETTTEPPEGYTAV